MKIGFNNPSGVRIPDCRQGRAIHCRDRWISPNPDRRNL